MGLPNDPSELAGATGSVAPAARTVEDVEREYQGRISGKDRAHAEAVTALQAQHAAALAALQQDSQSKLNEAVGKVTDYDALKTESDTLKQQLEEERRGRALDVRKVRFPKAAESLGDDIVTSMDEAKLAALETQLGSGATTQQLPVSSSPVLANTAPRSVGSAKAPEEMTSDELKSLLKQQESEFIASLR